MSLKFDVHSVDGKFNKTFQSMKEAEEYFGSHMIHSNISPDGIQKFYPADSKTEHELISYRQLRAVERERSVKYAFPKELGVSDVALENAGYQEVTKDNDSTWVLRGKKNIEMAMLTFCDAEPNAQSYDKCRDDVLVVLSEGRDAMLVRDMRNEAQTLADLAGREMQVVNSKDAYFAFPNEDTGEVRKNSIGMYVGSDSAIEKALDSVIGGDEELDVYLHWRSDSDVKQMKADAEERAKISRTSRVEYVSRGGPKM